MPVTVGKRTDNQRGAVLVMSLIFLLIMTLISSTGMRTTIMDEKMTGNMRDQNLAFQEAEAAIREAESWLWSLDTVPGTCTGTSCALSSSVWAVNKFISDDLAKKDDTWWNANAVQYNETGSGQTTFGGTTHYMVQHLSRQKLGGFVADGQEDDDYEYYRVVARSSGGSGNANVVLESNFSRNFAN